MATAKSFTGLLLLSVVCACRRAPEPPRSFVASLRCGMTRTEVTQLARVHRYAPSDRGWLSRSAAAPAAAAKELTLVDLTFRDGRLVAVREGVRDPRSRRTEWRTTQLCGPR